ncbi:MAG: DUF697 domain-containing protein [Leptolyngbyaceae cyanobacterium RU_5_1]|nr:DUF697 domain-containing protein [Leptolyngbyaceae cyanobacterium RU_5_1]
MSNQLQRPLVIGGIALSLVIWFLELLNHAVGEWGSYAVVAAAISAGVWWIHRQSDRRQVEQVLPKYVDSTAVKRTLSEAEQVITQLQLEVEESTPGLAAIQPQVSFLHAQIAQIAQELEREALRMIVMGAKGSGKTTLIQLMQSDWVSQVSKPIISYEAPSFSVGTDTGLDAEAIALKQANTADLVLFLVTGDLTESELQTLKRLATRKRTVLVFNKRDQYLPEEQQTILSRMQEWGRGVLDTADVVAATTAPKPLKVRQHQPDGSFREWLEDQSPDIAALTQRLSIILQQESRQLVLASSLSNAMDLKAQAATALNDARRTRALPIVEKFQWIAAATAFASPMPTLDVVATAAINVQMILDLGAIYQQKLSLDQAQKAVTTLGSLILKLGLVELTTRTIANVLKTNAITYVAGGCIQAVSAAYLTRVAGLALIEYFHSQDPALTPTDAKPLAIDRLSQILQQVFQQNQQFGFLQSLSGQVMERFAPKVSQPQQTVSPLSPLPTLESSSSPPQPLTPLAIPLSLPQPDVEVLEHNGSGVHVSVRDLDSTSIPSR